MGSARPSNLIMHRASSPPTSANGSLADRDRETLRMIHQKLDAGWLPHGSLREPRTPEARESGPKEASDRAYDCARTQRR